MTQSQIPKKMACAPARRKLRIAVVYSRLPFPMMRGDQTTVAHLISFLSERRHSVDLYTISAGGQITPDQSAWLNKACRSVHIYQQNLWAMLRGLIRGLVNRTPIQVSLFDNRAMGRDLSNAIDADEYDIIYCYYPRTALAVPDLTNKLTTTRSFLALQLSQTLNTERMARNESNRLKRYGYLIEARLMGRFESRIWRRFHRVVLIGPADVAAVIEQCGAHGQPEIDNWIYGAHGTDTDKFVPAVQSEVVPRRVVFSGSMLYPPNVQAAHWFVNKVWPRIRSNFPDATFIIQGRDPSATIRALDGRDGITVTGTVPDVATMIRSAHVCVNPMLAAGGMQNKLLEYLACGKAVVASSIANEGIMAPSDVVIVADDPDEFADAVIRVLSGAVDAAELGDRAREYVLSQWTWEAHFLTLEDDFVRALDDSQEVNRTRAADGAQG